LITLQILYKFSVYEALFFQFYERKMNTPRNKMIWIEKGLACVDKILYILVRSEKEKGLIFG